MSEQPKIKNLWGDLSLGETIRTPYIILKEQASILTEATNGLLIAEVRKEQKIAKIKSEYDFNCVLDIKVPAINNYSISVVTIKYPVTIYPAKIYRYIQNSVEGKVCKNEEELEENLEAILSSQEVRRIVSGLLSEVRADKTVQEA